MGNRFYGLAMADDLIALNLPIGLFRFTIEPQEALQVPAVNKGNMLRGGFGHAFRRLCCIPQCRDTKSCPLAASCPYKAVFEPSPPPGSERLSKNQDIPRPFVFRAPLTQQTRFERGQRFEFGLVLIGRALDFLPYFVLSFRELASEGLGLNRARCTLEQVQQTGVSSNDASHPAPDVAPPLTSALAVLPPASQPASAAEATPHPFVGARSPRPKGIAQPFTAAGSPHVVYTSADKLFRAPASVGSQGWISARLQELRDSNGRGPTQRITIRFLTPTFLRADGEVIRRPEFHHVFKRLRDRINALSTFFGEGPMEEDFRGLGERAERVRTVSAQTDWVERFRTSSKTRQRHELSGFVGEATYGGEVSEFLPWLTVGEFVHVGKHTAWGNGHYQVHG